MEDLINRVTSTAGVEEDVAKSAIAIILNFLSNDGPSDKIGTLMGSLQGAEQLMQENPGTGEGGLMGTYNELVGAGLDMSTVPAVGKEIVSYMRDKAGEDTVNEIVASIPGLSQFV